jgi:DNA-binding CsgD family transcriptional regulator
MKAIPPITKALELVHSAVDLESLQRAISDIRDIYCLSHTVLHVTNVPLIKQENPLLLLTYPDEWVELYKSRNYFAIDPVVNAGRAGFLPMDWSTLDWSTPQNYLFMKQADNYGVGRHGVTLTIRGPQGERSLFTVTSNCSSRDWSILRNSAMNDFQVLGHYIHDQAMLVSGLRSENVPHLSKRETQCLQLVAQGSAPKQIATHLALSESAVRLYLGSCRRKLHATSTAHAIGRAVSLEFIRP